MRRSKISYEVFLDYSAAPPMYGIRYGDRATAGRLSTDYASVNRLAQLCNQAGLSDIHLKDIAEDFCRA